MKKILLSLFTVVGVAALVAGSTKSVFSDTEKIEGNSFSTATIDLIAQGEASEVTVKKPLVVTDLFPGDWSDWARGALRNNSSGDAKIDVYMYVDNVKGDICDDVNLKVTTGFAGDDTGPYGERSVELYNKHLLDLQGIGKIMLVNTDKSPFGDGIPHNITQVIQQQAQLDSNADNDDQGKSCTWDEVFVDVLKREGAVPDIVDGANGKKILNTENAYDTLNTKISAIEDNELQPKLQSLKTQITTTNIQK